MNDQASAVFIRIPKTASTSIETVLRRYPCVLLNSTSKLLPRKNWPENWMDTGLSNLWSGVLGEEAYDRLFSFAFVRNPYERACSSWLHVRNKCREGKIVARRASPGGGSEPLPVETFDDYLHLLSDQLLVGQASWHSTLQSSHVIDRSGELNVDFIGRFENLQADFDEVVRRIGGNSETLPHVRVGNRSKRDYRSCYNPSRKAIVEKLFSADFELFEYPRRD